MKKRVLIKGWIRTAALYSLVSVAVLLMLVGRSLSAEVQEYISIGIGALFWIGILGGSGSYYCLWRRFRKESKRSQMNHRWTNAIRFFKNPYATAADSVLIFSVLLNIYGFLAASTTFIVAWLGIFLLITSFYFHFLFNGRIFQYIINKE